MLINLEAPNDEWDYKSALREVLHFRSDLMREFQRNIYVSRKRIMPESEQPKFSEQSTELELVILVFPTERHLKIALKRRILLKGFELSSRRYIQAREPFGRTLMGYGRSSSASLEAQKDDLMDGLVSDLSSFGLSRYCAEEDIEMN
ncbi:hypothetical protein ONS95_008152 [Cadophora gregata]|uniref:uncharacterized protein n=1 Tax=Cadophora gregata TaxID=51156 RepID=UPI0026DD7292|nr:uncharacterized protein ONS95_008152 [Cadophora gregata]KAK0126563.1 hypothetical protein ONS95_008152 [Cadophora gregata]